jgi:predicted nucleic acid binding AN1-type Zn finger protein
MAFAVRIAGHCSKCNPFFSVEHTLQIEDQYADFSGDCRRLNS